MPRRHRGTAVVDEQLGRDLGRYRSKASRTSIVVSHGGEAPAQTDDPCTPSVTRSSRSPGTRFGFSRASRGRVSRSASIGLLRIRGAWHASCRHGARPRRTALVRFKLLLGSLRGSASTWSPRRPRLGAACRTARICSLHGRRYIVGQAHRGGAGRGSRPAPWFTASALGRLEQPEACALRVRHDREPAAGVVRRSEVSCAPRSSAFLNAASTSSTAK